MRRRPEPPGIPPPGVLRSWTLDCGGIEEARESIRVALVKLGGHQVKLLAGLAVALLAAAALPQLLSGNLILSIAVVVIALAASSALAVQVFQAFTWTLYLRSLEAYLSHDGKALDEYCGGEAEA